MNAIVEGNSPRGEPSVMRPNDEKGEDQIAFQQVMIWDIPLVG